MWNSYRAASVSGSSDVDRIKHTTLNGSVIILSKMPPVIFGKDGWFWFQWQVRVRTRTGRQNQLSETNGSKWSTIIDDWTRRRATSFFGRSATGKRGIKDNTSFPLYLDDDGGCCCNIVRLSGIFHEPAEVLPALPARGKGGRLLLIVQSPI